MLSLPVDILLPSSSKLAQRPLQRINTYRKRIQIPLQRLSLPTSTSTPTTTTSRSFTCSSCSRTTAFVYLSNRRSKPVISIAMSTIIRRNVSSTPSSSKPPAREPKEHDHGHGHSHSHSHDGHDHGHSHGIFSTHTHDHSEGADQIMQALSKGRLDRGTRITLLG